MRMIGRRIAPMEPAMSKAARDVEKDYPLPEFVAKLRRLADAIENGARFDIQIAGERLSVPARAAFSIEHERGVAVYSAHRDTHFAFLKVVVIGDEIAVTRRDGKTFRYRADRSEVVRFDASGIDPLADGYAIALTTCWPFDAVTSGPLRYVLHATLIDHQP
jgi:hypothetical protein